MPMMEPKKPEEELVEDYRVTQMVLEMDQLQYADKVYIHKKYNESLYRDGFIHIVTAKNLQSHVERLEKLLKHEKTIVKSRYGRIRSL